MTPNESGSVGKICTCTAGKIGIITYVRFVGGKPMWHGVNLYTGGAWQSTGPVVIAENIDAWVEQRYLEMLDSA